MELREIVEKKKQLAMDIASLLQRFEEETGLDVSGIDMVRQSSCMYNEESGEYDCHRYAVDPKIML